MLRISISEVMTYTFSKNKFLFWADLFNVVFRYDQFILKQKLLFFIDLNLIYVYYY